jgi:hypothetical protein
MQVGSVEKLHDGRLIQPKSSDGQISPGSGTRVEQ